MKICVCDKNNKNIEIDKEDVVIIYSIIGIILVTIIFFNPLLSLGFCMVILGYILLTAIARALLIRHSLYCSLRWSIISVARVAQYF